jgi:hypothetical protein
LQLVFHIDVFLGKEVKMKKYLKHLIAGIGFFGIAMSANAQWVVSDPLTEIMTGFGYVEEITQYETQLQQFETQVQHLTTAQGALAAITGGRGMGAFVNIQSMRQTAPTSAWVNPTTTSGAQAMVTQTSAQLASSANRVNMLTQLISQIDSTTDEKGSLDLNARIQAEHAFLLNEATMLQAGKDNQAAQANVQAVQNKAAAIPLIHGSSAPF